MYVDFHNTSSTSITTSKSFNGNNQSLLWKNISMYPNRTKPNNDEMTVKFVLKNDEEKKSKPIKVFSVPIMDKSTYNKISPYAAIKKKRKHESFEYSGQGDEEYEYEDNTYKKPKPFGQKLQGQRVCRRRGGQKMKKFAKYMLPAAMGFLTFKLVLVPIMLKILAIMSAKGIFLGMASFIMATLLSLKQIIGSNTHHEHRRNDVLLVPISFRKTGNHQHYHKNDEYLEYEHNPYNAHYNIPTNTQDLDRNSNVKTLQTFY